MLMSDPTADTLFVIVRHYAGWVPTSGQLARTAPNYGLLGKKGDRLTTDGAAKRLERLKKEADNVKHLGFRYFIEDSGTRRQVDVDHVASEKETALIFLELQEMCAKKAGSVATADFVRHASAKFGLTTSTVKKKLDRGREAGYLADAFGDHKRILVGLRILYEQRFLSLLAERITLSSPTPTPTPSPKSKPKVHRSTSKVTQGSPPPQGSP
jgi:hypothetical protein